MTSALVSKRICEQTRAGIITMLNSTAVQPWGTKVAEHRLQPALIADLESAIDSMLADGAKAIVLHNEGIVIFS